MNELLSLPVIDLISLAYLLLAGLVGLKRGLSGELARLGSIVVAVFAGWKLHGPLGQLVSETTRLEGTDAFLASFLGIFFGATLLLAILRWALRKVMAMSFHPVVNRVGGFAAGGIRGLLVLSVFFIAVGVIRVPYLQRKFVEESHIGSFVMEQVLPVYSALKDTAVEGMGAEGMGTEGMGAGDEDESEARKDAL